MTKIKIGLAGCGFVSELHMYAYRRVYGVEVEVAFVERLRGMVAFDGVDALLETMRDDVRRTREVLDA